LLVFSGAGKFPHKRKGDSKGLCRQKKQLKGGLKHDVKTGQRRSGVAGNSKKKPENTRGGKEPTDQPR